MSIYIRAFQFFNINMKALFNYFKKFLDFVWFKVICSWKFFLLLVVKKRHLEIISQNYFRRWLFDRAFISIDLELQNAIWIRVNGFKSHKINRPILVDLQNLNGEFIEIEVFGFSESKLIKIKIEELHSLASDSFKVNIQNISGIVLAAMHSTLKMPKLTMGLPKPGLVAKPILTIREVLIMQDAFEIKNQEFNLTEFI